jgi:hypothetical protein
MRPCVILVTNDVRGAGALNKCHGTGLRVARLRLTRPAVGRVSNRGPARIAQELAPKVLGVWKNCDYPEMQER